MKILISTVAKALRELRRSLLGLSPSFLTFDEIDGFSPQPFYQSTPNKNRLTGVLKMKRLSRTRRNKAKNKC